MLEHEPDPGALSDPGALPDEAVCTLDDRELAFEAELRDLLALPEPSASFDARVLEAARREAVAAQPLHPRLARLIAFARPLAAAAALLLVAGLTLPATAPRQQTLAPVENPLGISPLRGARVLSAVGAIDGGGRSLLAGHWVDSGDPLVVQPDGHLFLCLAEGTELAFDGGAQATLRFDHRVRRIDLRAGRLYADVVKVGSTAEQRPIVVGTPAGEARVLGTELTAQASAGTTRLTVRHGLVKLSNTLGAAYVGASETGLLTERRRPASRRTARVDRHFRWIGKLQPGGYHPAEKAFGGGPVGEDEPAIGSLVARTADGRRVALALAEQRFETLVQEGVAHTTVRFAFRNVASQALEGTFRFALPKAASISRYAVRQGETWVEGRVVEREAARRIYEEQKRELKDPALLEWSAGSAFTAKVFPIEPQAVKQLEVTYVEELPERRGVARLVLPLVSETSRLSPPERLRVTCRLLGSEARVAVRCPSHHAELGYEDGARVVRLDARDLQPRNDFVLELARATAPAVEASVELPAVTGERRAPAGGSARGLEPTRAAALVRLRPDLSWLGDDVMPSRVVVLADASRSQAGTLKEVQLELLEGLLQALPDRVRPELFTYHVALDAQPSEGPDHDEGLLAALWNAEVGGGSDLGRAFTELGRRLPLDAGATLVYLGDGTATAGLRDPTALRRLFARALPPSRVRRLITVGIGPDTDAALLESLARERDGVHVAVRPGDELGRKVDEAVSALTEPVLTQVAVDLGPDAEFVAPQALSNLRDGETLSLSAWVNPTLRALPVVLSGVVAGRAFELRRTVDLTLAAPGAQLADVWARRRVADLLQAGPAGRDAVLDLAIDYGIVTPYTSLVVLSPEEYERYALADSRRRAERELAKLEREAQLGVTLKQLELASPDDVVRGTDFFAPAASGERRREIAGGQVATLTDLTAEDEAALDNLRQIGRRDTEYHRLVEQLARTPSDEEVLAKLAEQAGVELTRLDDRERARRVAESGVDRALSELRRASEVVEKPIVILEEEVEVAPDVPKGGDLSRLNDNGATVNSSGGGGFGGGTIGGSIGSSADLPTLDLRRTREQAVETEAEESAPANLPNVRGRLIVTPKPDPKGHADTRRGSDTFGQLAGRGGPDAVSTPQEDGWWSRDPAPTWREADGLQEEWGQFNNGAWSTADGAVEFGRQIPSQDGEGSEKLKERLEPVGTAQSLSREGDKDMLWFGVTNPAVPTTTGDRYFVTNEQGVDFYTEVGAFSLAAGNSTVSTRALPVGKEDAPPADERTLFSAAVVNGYAGVTVTPRALRELVQALDDADPAARGELFDQASGVCFALESQPAQCAWLTRELLRYAPQDLDLHELLGTCYELLGRRRAAVRAYSGLVEAQPDDVRARLRYALALERLGFVDEALIACAAAVALDDGLPQARFALARIAVRAGRLDVAEAQLEALLARPYAVAEHGDVHGQARAGLRAIYRQAIETWPSDAARYRAALEALGD